MRDFESLLERIVRRHQGEGRPTRSNQTTPTTRRRTSKPHHSSHPFLEGGDGVIISGEGCESFGSAYPEPLRYPVGSSSHKNPPPPTHLTPLFLGDNCNIPCDMGIDGTKRRAWKTIAARWRGERWTDG